MAKKAVFGVATDESDAVELLNRLRSGGVPPQKISAVFSLASSGEKVSRGDTGGVLAELEWLRFAAFEVSGLGPVIAAGPIVETLSRAPRAALAGSDGALAQAGVSLDAAERYQARIRDGEIFIVVHTEDGEDESRGREILPRSG